MALFSFCSLKGSFLRSLDLHLSNSFCIWSVGYTTVKYQLNSVPFRIYLSLSTIFLISQVILFPREKSLQSNTLKSPSLSENTIFFIMTFSQAGCWSALKCVLKDLEKTLSLKSSLQCGKKSFNWPHCNGQ